MEENTEDQLTLFVEDSPVKTCQLQEKKQASMAKEAPYTGKCLELLASVCHDTQFLKTSQDSLLESQDGGLDNFSMTWPRSGTMQNGTVYRLPNLARTITEIGSGLLPTPTTMDRLPPKSDKAFKKEMEVTRKGRSQPANLRDFLARGFLPTPKSSDYKGSARNRYRGSAAYRSNLAESLRASHEDSIYPNPNFVEQMMGFPVGHTDLNN